MLLYLPIEGRVHIHRHRFDPLARLAELLEEGAYGLTAVAFARPLYASALGIHADGGIAMALTAARQRGCERLESQREGVFDVLMAGSDSIARLGQKAAR